MWPVALSGRLPVNALVGHHPANKLIGRDPIPCRKKAFPTPPCGGAEHPVLPPVSRSYSGAQGRLVTHYSPVRHSHPGSKLPGIPFDLHVLSTPPAFILSQNRTLHKKTSWRHPTDDSYIISKRNQTDHPIRKDGHTKTPDTNQGPLGPPTRRTNPPHRHASELAS